MIVGWISMAIVSWLLLCVNYLVFTKNDLTVGTASMIGLFCLCLAPLTMVTAILLWFSYFFAKIFVTVMDFDKVLIKNEYR